MFAIWANQIPLKITAKSLISRSLFLLLRINTSKISQISVYNITEHVVFTPRPCTPHSTSSSSNFIAHQINLSIAKFSHFKDCNWIQTSENTVPQVFEGLTKTSSHLKCGFRNQRYLHVQVQSSNHPAKHNNTVHIKD